MLFLKSPGFWHHSGYNQGKYKTLNSKKNQTREIYNSLVEIEIFNKTARIKAKPWML